MQGGERSPRSQRRPGSRAAPAPFVCFSPNFPHRFVEPRRATASSCGGGREVWLEITKPAPPGCGRPPCPQGRERDHSTGRRDTPKGPAGEPRCPPRGGGGGGGGRRGPEAAGAAADSISRHARRRAHARPATAPGAHAPPSPPPRPQPGCARRSSGNTMEAAPQPRPRPGGAAAAASASPLSPPPPPPPPPEQERKLEQEKLSGVVKSVHRRLRKKYREGNRGGGGCPPAIRAAQAGPPRSPRRGSRAGRLGAVGNGGAVRRGAAVPRREEGRRPRWGARRGSGCPPAGGAERGAVGRPGPLLSRCRSGAGRLGRRPLPKGVCRWRWGGGWLGAAPGSLPAPPRSTAEEPRSGLLRFCRFPGVVGSGDPFVAEEGSGRISKAFPVGCRRRRLVCTDNAAR